jgi:hypothetical protein
MLFSRVFIYLLAFIYLHGIHRLGFLLEEVFSVRYELNIYVIFSLQRINVWIHKGLDRDGPQRTGPNRRGRIRFTSEAVPRDNKDSAFPKTGHEPQKRLYTKTYFLTDRQIRRITCMWTEISFLENTSIDGVMDCVLSFFSL